MKRVAISAFLLSLLTASVAMAGQGFRGAPEHRVEHSRKHDDGRTHSPRHDSRKDYHHEHRRDSRSYNRHHDGKHHSHAPHRHVEVHKHVYHHAPVRYHWGPYVRPHGYYHHHWKRGDRLPTHYYARPYVIADYHACGLRRPPHGHHWVRVDKDAVLAVIATGLVLDVVYNHFY